MTVQGVKYAQRLESARLLSFERLPAAHGGVRYLRIRRSPIAIAWVATNGSRLVNPAEEKDVLMSTKG